MAVVAVSGEAGQAAALVSAFRVVAARVRVTPIAVLRTFVDVWKNDRMKIRINIVTIKT